MTICVNQVSIWRQAAAAVAFDVEIVLDHLSAAYKRTIELLLIMACTYMFENGFLCVQDKLFACVHVPPPSLPSTPPFRLPHLHSLGIYV